MVTVTTFITQILDTFWGRVGRAPYHTDKRYERKRGIKDDCKGLGLTNEKKKLSYLDMKKTMRRMDFKEVRSLV